MDHPFRCSLCETLLYSKKITEVPKCCPSGQVRKLVNICLLIPCPEGQTPVHISGSVPGISEGGRKWVVACGKERLPVIHTSEPSACTCKGCREYIKNLYKSAGWEVDVPKDDLQEDGIQISFEDDPANDCNC